MWTLLKPDHLRRATLVMQPIYMLRANFYGDCHALFEIRPADAISTFSAAGRSRAVTHPGHASRQPIAVKAKLPEPPKTSVLTLQPNLEAEI